MGQSKNNPNAYLAKFLTIKNWCYPALIDFGFSSVKVSGFNIQI